MRFGKRELLGIVVSVGLLWLTLHKIEWAEVWRELREANVGLFVLSALVATCTFPLRARRWRTILDPVEPNIPHGKLWRSTAIGMMVNNVVPARAGELARVYALTREVPRVGFAAGFASLAVDRLFDAVVLFGLMLAAMFDPVFPGETRIGSQTVAHWAGGATLALVALLTLLYAIVMFPARIITIYELLVRRIAPKLEARGKDILLAFAAGLGVLRSPRRFATVLAWSIVHWLVNAVAFWIAFKAVGIGVPFSAALFLQGLIAIGIALPAAPGFFGVFEAVATVGLGIYGVPRELAVSWALGYHLLSFIPITALGAFYFTRLGMHFKDIDRGASGKDSNADDSLPDDAREPIAAPRAHDARV